MSVVSLLGIKVLNNPAKFTDSYEFEITFECLEQLKEDLEWKLTYVGSSDSLEHDQELDSVLVGPVPVGINKFVLMADAPSPDLIPAKELVSVTVILLSCSYKEREFVRVGYYVNNEYDTEELRENPPNKVQVEHIVRNILAEKPRVTKFNIVWDNEGTTDEYPPEQPEDDLEDDVAIDLAAADEDDDEEEEGDIEDEGNEKQHEDDKEEDQNSQPAKRINTSDDAELPEAKRHKLDDEDVEEELSDFEDEDEKDAQEEEEDEEEGEGEEDDGVETAVDEAPTPKIEESSAPTPAESR